MAFDVHHIRNQFPFFKNNPELVYFDNASTTQKPISVLNSLKRQYTDCNANVHRGVYKLAEEATAKFEMARDVIADFIGTPNRDSVIFTSGATGSINLVANSWGRHNLEKGDRILISEMEHHSNIVPWHILSSDLGVKIDFIPIDKNGELILDDLDNLITEKTRLVSIIHQSNVLGTINPINEIINSAHAKGAKVLIDGAQSIAHQDIDVDKIDCDFFVFSGHKIYGPTGLGVLYCKRDSLDQMTPFNGGGEMIKEVSRDGFTLNENPWRFEPGTPPFSQAVALSDAIKFITDINIDDIAQYENQLTHYIEDKIVEIDGIRLYGSKRHRGPCISFNIENIHSYDLTKIIDEMGIAIRSGNHCAQPLMNSLGIFSSSRVSLSFYNTYEEADKFLESVKKATKILI